MQSIKTFLSRVPKGNRAQVSLGIRRPTFSCYQKVCLVHDSANVSENGIQWLFPAETSIERLHAAAKFAQHSLLSHMTINAAIPLQENHFLEALTHFCRKTPSFRTCIRRRKGRLWVCEYPELKLDFKMMDSKDLLTERDKLLLQPFEDSSEGPLWCLRILPAPADAPCPLPHLKAAFPHQYDILFFVHHCISDGTATMASLIYFLQLLESVVARTPVSPEPFGKVVGEQKTMALEREMQKRLESNPQEFQRMIDEAANKEFTPLLQQAFGTPPKPDFPMDFVSAEINPQTLKDFDKRCRAIGITLNSGMVSVVNTALVELVAEKGLVKDNYSVRSSHAVDMRRYWKGNPMTDFGTHNISMTNTMDTPRHNRTGFWDYAKQFDTEFRRQLKEGSVLQEKIIKSKIRPKDFSHEVFYNPATTPSTTVDYMFSNVVLPHFSNFGIGETVQLTSMRSFHNACNSDFSNLHMFIWFRDTVTYRILSASNRISRDTTQAFLDKVMEVLSSLTK